MKLKNTLNLISYVHVKSCFIFYWICKILFLVYFTIVLIYVEDVDSCHKGSFEQELATYKNPHVTLNAISSFFSITNLFF
jgi:hypothetical protein